MLSDALAHLRAIEESSDSYLRHPHVVMVLDVNTRLKDCLNLAAWTAEHDGKLDIVSLDIAVIETLHTEFEKYNYTPITSFHCQDAMKFLLNTVFSPLVYIDAPDAQTGATLFRLAVSAGAQVVLFGNFGMQAGQAVREARNIGMMCHQIFGNTHLISR